MTLKEMAKISGYSVSTVSKALNDEHDISDLTKIKIKEIAKVYNYIPNRQARALRNKKTNIIAVVLPKFCLKKYASILEGFEEEAQSRGYRIIISQYDDKKTNNLSKLFYPIEGYVEGLMFFMDNKKVLREYEYQFNIIKQRSFSFMKCYHDFAKSKGDLKDRQVGNLRCANLIDEILNQRKAVYIS